jgi:hypothetical protein
MSRLFTLLLLMMMSRVYAADRPPNVILVMADDMGWAQTSYYGHPLLKTPNLDAMAGNGLRFDRFYAGAPSCSPTRASVITGRTNERTGVMRVGDSINKQEKSVATAFRHAGYTTAHFGKWHLNDVALPGENPMPVDDPHNPGELGFDYWLSATNQFNLDPVLSRNGQIEKLKGESSEVLVNEALKRVRKGSRYSSLSGMHRPIDRLRHRPKTKSHLRPSTPLRALTTPKLSPWTAQSAICDVA